MVDSSPQSPDHRIAKSPDFSLFAAIVATLLLSSCDSSKPVPTTDEVVIYCSVDTAFAEPILAEFEKRTNIRVHRQYDTEAGKTTGLVNKLLAEKQNPRADVWWSGEIFGTMQLAADGILAEYHSPAAADIPEKYRDKNGLWTAFGLRGRVIAYDPKRTNPEDLPKRWADLVDPKYKGKVAMADPRFGTTRGHMATLYALWDKDPLTRFYEGLRANEFRRADGNSHAVLLLSRGVVDFACTDTDDVIVARERGDSIAMCYPDLDSPQSVMTVPGTLWIPSSVGLVNGARHESAARKLIDYLVSPDIERKLAASESRNVPVRAALLKELDSDNRAFSRLFFDWGNQFLEELETGTFESWNEPPKRPRTFPHPPAAVSYSEAAAALKDSDRLVADVLLK